MEICSDSCFFLPQVHHSSPIFDRVSVFWGKYKVIRVFVLVIFGFRVGVAVKFLVILLE